jgi:hypothetical protein
VATCGFAHGGLGLAVGDKIKVDPPKTDGDEHAQQTCDPHYPVQMVVIRNAVE